MKYETIEKIVKASGVRAGELVLVHFWGEDADKAIANRFVAAESGLDPQEYIRRMDRAYDIDYDAVRAACTQAPERFDGACVQAARTAS